MAKKKVIEDIQDKISIIKLCHGLKAGYIIIHPDKERSIFVNDEIPKSADLSDHLGVKVIITKEVGENEIVIGI